MWWFINTKHLWEEHSITGQGGPVCDGKADWLHLYKLHVSVSHRQISEGVHRLQEAKHRPLILQPCLWLMRLMCGSYLPQHENERFIYYLDARWWACVRQWVCFQEYVNREAEIKPYSPMDSSQHSHHLEWVEGVFSCCTVRRPFWTIWKEWSLYSAAASRD